MNKIKYLLAIVLCLWSGQVFAANGDIIAARIKGTEPGNGWVLQVDVESSGGSAIQTGGTSTGGRVLGYSPMVDANNTPNSAAPVLTVVSKGFDNTGAARRPMTRGVTQED